MDGVVRPPSAFSITRALPPSNTETQELVVPKSIPIILPISISYRLAIGQRACLFLYVGAGLAISRHEDQ